MHLLLALLACSGSPAPAPAPSAAPASPAAPAPRAPVPPAEARAAAPTLTVYGLQIGKSPAADMEAWLTAHGLTCPPAPSPRRTTTRYVCTGDIPVTVLPDRVVKGKIDQVLLVRGDNGPLRHFSSSRKYSLPTDAVADYSSALTALTSTFGIPTIVAPAPDLAKLDDKVVRYATAWLYSDLEVRLTLLKVSTSYISVSETWDQPGVSEDDETRAMPPGAHGDPGGHGGGDPYGHGGPSGASTGDPYGHGAAAGAPGVSPSPHP